VNTREKHIKGDYTHIDPASISSVTRNLSSTIISNSPICNTKKAEKRKAEDKVAPPISAYEKKLRMVAALDISLDRNPASHISLDGKSGANSLKYGGFKFHVPVELSWDYGGHKSDISINAWIV